MKSSSVRIKPNPILLLLFILPLISSAQVVVVDEEMEPVQGAVVTLMSSPDSTFVEAVLSDMDGKVSIDRNIDGILSVECVGYEKALSSMPLLSDTITLHPLRHALEAVTVAARRNYMKREHGKFIFDPGILRKQVSNGYSLLQMTPLIDLKDATLNILGKGASVIHINGRKPMMEQKAVMEMLRSLPPSQIKRVEIITQPGASYSATVSGGIVNVVIDNPTQGLTGNVSAEAEYIHQRVAPRGGLWLGYSKDRLDASANIDYFGFNNKSEIAST